MANLHEHWDQYCCGRQQTTIDALKGIGIRYARGYGGPRGMDRLRRHPSLQQVRGQARWGPAAKYYMRSILENFNFGLVKSSLYELLDLNSAQDCAECRYGLAKGDGTLKKAGTAVKNLIQILPDKGNAGLATTPLPYSLEGGGGFKEYSATGANGYDGFENCMHHAVFQKADGTYYLALWQEGKSYLWSTGSQAPRDAPPADQKVVVAFGKTFAGIRTFLPLEAGYGSPRNVYANLATLTVDVPDHPLIPELRPSGTRTRSPARAPQAALFPGSLPGRFIVEFAARTEGGAFDILDQAGRKVATVPFAPGDRRAEIDASALPPGVYLVKAAGEARWIGKFIHLGR